MEELRLEDYMLNRKYPWPAGHPLATTYPETNDGTRLVKYAKTNLVEISPLSQPLFQRFLEVSLTSVTAMPEFKDMSMEELRFYDYKNGLRYPLKRENNSHQIEGI
jgi:hypothetical protein